MGKNIYAVQNIKGYVYQNGLSNKRVDPLSHHTKKISNDELLLPIETIHSIFFFLKSKSHTAIYYILGGSGHYSANPPEPYYYIVFPCILRALQFVKSNSELNAEFVPAKSGQSCLFSEHIERHVHPDDRPYRIVHDASTHTSNIFYPEDDERDRSFDGINCCINEDGSIEKYIAFLTIFDAYYTISMVKLILEKKNHILPKENIITMQQSGKAHNFIMLCSNENKIMYATENIHKNTYLHYILYDHYSCTILKKNFSVDFITKKLISLNEKNDTYLLLTKDGQLIVLWFTPQGDLHYWKQRHTSKFTDIAVNRSKKTSNGFMPYIALLNNKNEIFVCDMLYGLSPLLFKTAQLSFCPHGDLLYDKEEIGILLYQDRKYVTEWLSNSNGTPLLQCRATKEYPVSDYHPVIVFSDHLQEYIFHRERYIS